ncbi:MAG: L-erythro-3,5-diaminohexanoate dehydrogenase, partial [Myxococcales bacterium]
MVRPKGVLPQQAEALDPGLVLGDDELLVDVEHLNIDAASFRQLWTAAQKDPQVVTGLVTEIVRNRGKMHNPVTGSGGMLIGRVSRIGPAHPAASELKPGERIATLVSLTLTPLVLDEIVSVQPKAERLEVRGKAILFASGLWARLPEDLPLEMALAVLDVCGAPAWVARLAKKGQRVLVLGAGKSGSLACAQARKNGAQVTALDYRREAAQRLVSDGLADASLAADATRPLDVYAQTRGVF